MDEVRIKISSSEEEFHSLEAVFNEEAYKTSDTITLLTDVTMGHPIVITRKCTLDLGGHFIFVPFSNAITVKNGALVDIINGKIQTLSPDVMEDVITSQGSKTVTTLGEGLEIDVRGSAVHVKKRGSVVVAGAAVRARGEQPTVCVDDEVSTLTVESGKVASYEKQAVAVRSGGQLIVNGGEVYTESNGLVPETAYPSVVVDGQNSKIIVNNGAVFSEKTSAISVAYGEVEIHGGEVYTKSNDYNAVGVHRNNTKFYMSDGWVYATKTPAILSNELEWGDLHNIQIDGGKVGGEGFVFLVAGPGDHIIHLTAGKVKGHVPQEYLPAGYVVSDIKDEDGYADIILKTWTSPEDLSPIFPSAEADPEVDDNPFESVPDSNDVEILPFPPAPIAGDYSENDQADVILATNELSMPEIDPYEPPKVPFYGPGPIAPNYGPIPMPGPRPGPAPNPRPQDITSPIYNSSVNIKRPIHIYRTPSRKTMITEWKGALTILDGAYRGPDGDEYVMVKFRIPGSGKATTGYALVYDIGNHQ